MSEREITITLKAKNLTADDFQKAREGLAGLDDSAKKASSSGEAFTLSWGHAAVAAGAVVGVVAAIGGAMVAAAAGIAELGARGSEVSDVRQQFDTLNVAAGNVSGTMLGTLRTALKGTVTDFEIMKSTNVALSQGLKLNESQFDLTGRAARVLADRVGGDTADAYGKLVNAMATGQDRTLKEIGLNIDAEAAVKRYADSLGYEVGQLTEAEQVAAKRQAILNELNNVLAVSGDAEVDFADMVDQGKTALSNFYDEVSEGIAQSPVLAAALGPISTALSEAFGPHKKQLLDLVIRGIEEAAQITLKLGEVGLTMAETLTGAFFSVRNTLIGTVATVKEGLASLPGATDAMKQSAQEWRAKANESEQAGTMFASMLGRLREGLGEARAAMQEASREQRENATASQGQAVEQQRAAVAIGATGAAAGGAAPPVNRLTKEQKEAAKAAADLWKEVEKLNGQNMSLHEMVQKGIFGPFTTELKDTVSLQGMSTNAAGQARAAFESWANSNSAVLAPSIKQVSAATLLGGESATGFMGKIKGAFSQAGLDAQGLSGIFASAFTGGGGILGGLKAVATEGMGALLGMVPGVGPWLQAFSGPIIEGLSKLAGKAKDLLSSIFGGPDGAERKGREKVAEYEAQLHSTLTETQKLEAGTDAWKKTVVAVRDAYLAAGRTEAEALADTERLWKASKQGPEAVAAVIAEIQAKMKGTVTTAGEMADGITGAVARIPRRIEIEVEGKYNPPDIDGSNPGYAVGTKGRHGDYFVNFGAGTNTRLHGYEAVITPDQAPGFVAEYLKRNGGGGPATVNVYTVAEINTATGQVTQRVISQREYQRRTMRRIVRAGGIPELAGATA